MFKKKDDGASVGAVIGNSLRMLRCLRQVLSKNDVKNRALRRVGFQILG